MGQDIISQTRAKNSRMAGVGQGSTTAFPTVDVKLCSLFGCFYFSLAWRFCIKSRACNGAMELTSDDCPVARGVGYAANRGVVRTKRNAPRLNNIRTRSPKSIGDIACAFTTARHADRTERNGDRFTKLHKFGLNDDVARDHLIWRLQRDGCNSTNRSF